MSYFFNVLFFFSSGFLTLSYSLGGNDSNSAPIDTSTPTAFTPPDGKGISHVRLVGCNTANHIYRTTFGRTNPAGLDWYAFDGALVNVSTAGEYIFGCNKQQQCWWRSEKGNSTGRTPWECNGGGAAWAAVSRDGQHAWTTGTKWGGHPWYKSGLKGTKAGHGWKKFTTPGGKMDVVRVRNDNGVLVTNDTGDAYFSPDCAKSWKKVNTPGPVKHIDFTDNGDCLVCVTNDGTGYYNAGGQGWVQLEDPAGSKWNTLMICGYHIVGCDQRTWIYYRNFHDQTEWVKTNGALVNCDITSDDGSFVPGAKQWDYSQ